MKEECPRLVEGSGYRFDFDHQALAAEEAAPGKTWWWRERCRQEEVVS